MFCVVTFHPWGNEGGGGEIKAPLAEMLGEQNNEFIFDYAGKKASQIKTHLIRAIVCTHLNKVVIKLE